MPYIAPSDRWWTKDVCIAVAPVAGISGLGAVLFIAGLGSLTTCETPPMDTAQQRLGSNFLCYDTRYQSDQKYNPTAADYQALPTDACVNTAVAGYRTTDSKCKCRCSCDAKAAGYTGEGADCSDITNDDIAPIMLYYYIALALLAAAMVTSCVHLCCCCDSRRLFRCCGWAMAAEQVAAGVMAILFSISLPKIYEVLEEECYDCSKANVGGMVYGGIVCSFIAIPAGIWMVISISRTYEEDFIRYEGGFS